MSRSPCRRAARADSSAGPSRVSDAVGPHPWEQSRPFARGAARPRPAARQESLDVRDLLFEAFPAIGARGEPYVGSATFPAGAARRGGDGTRPCAHRDPARGRSRNPDPAPRDPHSGSKALLAHFLQDAEPLARHASGYGSRRAPSAGSRHRPRGTSAPGRSGSPRTGLPAPGRSGSRRSGAIRARPIWVSARWACRCTVAGSQVAGDPSPGWQAAGRHRTGGRPTRPAAVAGRWQVAGGRRVAAAGRYRTRCRSGCVQPAWPRVGEATGGRSRRGAPPASQVGPTTCPERKRPD